MEEVNVGEIDEYEWRMWIEECGLKRWGQKCGWRR